MPTSSSRRSTTELLLKGRPRRRGFIFHDGFNQPIHEAAPGILGMLEGRRVIECWKPPIVAWMDQAGHFFNHILHEFRDEPAFAPVRFEIEAMRTLDDTPDVKNRLLFQYLRTLAGELEREMAADLTPLRVPARAKDISLNGAWTAYYRERPGRYVERSIDLPVNWELVAGIDNYSGTMRFTRALSVPRSLYGKRLILSFLGVDYFADVWVNGHYVGGHEGCFGPFDLDISRCLRYGEVNVVRLSVTSPNEPAGGGVEVASGWHDFRPASAFPNRKTLIKGTLGHHDAKRGGAWSALTSQDGNTGGVWNDMFLGVRGPVRLARGSRVTTLALSPPAPGTGQRTVSAELRFPVESDLARPTGARLQVSIRPSNFEGTSVELEAAAVLRPGTNEIVLREDALGPIHVWEPWDRGFPHLYEVRAALDVESQPSAADEIRFETGFRTLSATPIGESTGPDGAFMVNGARVLVRGTNLLPTYWLSEYDEEAVERDFRLLRDAGFNAVLVHTLVGPKRLYERANRAGMLVVQIFPLQWSYDTSPEFVARARTQVRELADLLANEPSVVSYETHNEPDMRVAEGADNRFMDFELHAALRQADPHRWATTYSSGNHAYPGQFYQLRDDNSFATLPARFEESEFAGRRIARHRNMPTEFGIQAMPTVALFEKILSEDRVRDVIKRIRTDPKWRAGHGESWAKAEEALTAAKEVLGGGSWPAALGALDWRLMCKLGELHDEARELEKEGAPGEAVLTRKLAALLLDVLHYGAFKGENFWFGNWRPARTLPEFVAASQDRQYRLHKDAIETYLNAGVIGPIVGYFSFMFRDPDWQAPTWGVVDAEGIPKKAYRAYVESNGPVRVTLPQALWRPAKLGGDPWFGRGQDERGPLGDPWVTAEVVVANDTAEAIDKGSIDIWLEDATGHRLPLTARSGRRVETIRLPIDVEAGTGFSYFDRVPEARAGSAPSQWIVPESLAAGTYYLKASISDRRGRVLSTNSYELFVLDTTFPEVTELDRDQLETLLQGGSAPGFHYWSDGQVAYKADGGIKGFLAGYREAQGRGIDLYETVQGEHFFRHILSELEAIGGPSFLTEPIWRIRSETISPAEKTEVLFRYLEQFVARAQES